VEEIQIAIKRVRPGGAPASLPAYMTEGAAGMDLCADLSHDVQLGPLQRTLIPTGIAIALPFGYEAQIRPRSGVALKEGLTLINSPINLGSDSIIIRPGQRIAQMIVQRVVRALWQEVGELPRSERQAGGFGHTDEIRKR
jgi:dUTP pyrophosphatase